MAGNLFVKRQSAESLSVFVRRMADLLNLSGLQRRESSNYVDHVYYEGVCLSLSVKFARSDEVDVDGYEFWVNLKPATVWVDDQSFVEGLADLLARRLTVAGEAVVRLPRAELQGGTKIFYSLNPQATAGSREQVVVTVLP